MRWMIHGADHKTGRELTIVIEADDPRQAEQRALYNDILVSSISRFMGTGLARVVESPPAAPSNPAKTLSYDIPEQPPQSRPPLASAPSYKRIIAGARWLGGLAIAVRVMGVIGLVAALAVTLVPVVEPVRVWMPFTVIPTLWFVGGGLLLAMAFVCLFCGATIAMFSDLALAIRDIACNSFKAEVSRQPAEAAIPQPPPGMFLARQVGRLDDHRRPNSLLAMVATEPG